MKNYYKVLRKKIKKWLYGNCPGFAGSFPYFGTKVFFPQGSKIFELACQQGIYEIKNTELILKLIKPNTFYFDVGANIGLMAIPILNRCRTAKVLSWEPSPNTLPSLTLTRENSQFQDRWQVIGKAAGDFIGELDFAIASPELGAFDGFLDTKRAGLTKKITVPVTTLDSEWEAIGSPLVSIIKIDVEGAELQTLKGSTKCLQNNKPYILIEWTLKNLQAYGYESENLLDFAHEIGYQVFSISDFIPITNSTSLKLHMLKSESFLLVPDE
ncbi:FkbM family methyltransferase [Anabaena cylindrica UHCC 0172]|uniref:FkbM family methyltransferase n=1 Tax=Anabaena cylindrica TaxID=1165 RepID=UPI002B21AD42|nr:FkbM family methyltransferase [Anabaena cylindrica]MEA5553497.1 FkbM family methyltransferase [Anabaena cylindrica UHCC 0172]